MGFFDKLKGRSKEPKIDKPQTKAVIKNSSSESVDHFKERVENIAALYSQGKYAEAIDCLNSALMIYPQEPTLLKTKGMALEMKGNALAELGKHKEAIECYDEALKFNTGEDLERVKSERGTAFAFLGANLEDYNDKRTLNVAIECYDEALKFDLKGVISRSAILRRKSDTLFMLGKYKEAIECCDEVLKHNSQDVDTLRTKSLSLGKLGKYEEGIEHINAAIKIAPQDEFIWAMKGVFLVNWGKYNETIEFCEEALKLNPQNATALATKGKALLMLGNRQGLDYITEALNIDPQNVSALQIMGEIKDAIELQE